MSGNIGLDTNIVIRLFKNDPLVIKMLDGSSNICLPAPVVAELLFTAKNSQRTNENLKKYNEFIDACNVMNITRETADKYSAIRLALKRKGRPIPENDIWIAASCIEQDMPLVTGDAHFDNVDDLKVIKCCPAH